MNKDNAETKLAKAKSVLVLDHPFFASILLSLPMIKDESIPTLQTNGDEVRYNPAFIDKLSQSETLFVLAHETLHCVFQHMDRRGDRDAGRWNQAADYVINETLVNERVGTMPKGGLLNSELFKQGGGTAEGIYKIIPKPPPGQEPKPGEEGGPLDNVVDSAQDDAERSKKEAIRKVKIIQAANAAKMAGKLSAGVASLVKELTRSVVDWRAVLRRFLSERAKVELSYAKPKRRWLAEDINLPSLSGEKLGGIVFAVDCSGSVDKDTKAKFTAEMNAIKEDVKPSVVHVLYFDTEILRHDVFTEDEPIVLNFFDGGGTAFSPIFTYIDEKNINPTACVVLTDLCCSDFGDAPSYPVLWGSTLRAKAPFGEVVMIEEK